MIKDCRLATKSCCCSWFYHLQPVIMLCIFQLWKHFSWMTRINIWKLSFARKYFLVIQVNLDMTDSMGPGKLVRHMQNLSYTYDTYLICMGLGPSILSVIDKSLSYSGPSYPSSPVSQLLNYLLHAFVSCKCQALPSCVFGFVNAIIPEDILDKCRLDFFIFLKII